MVHVEESLQLPRDFEGFGPGLPSPKWPNNARLALSFVLNYEEGGERSTLSGDPCSESYLWEKGADSGAPRTARHLNSESDFEYGSRVGCWRISNLMQEFGWKMTVFGIVEALRKNPGFVERIRERGDEVAAHGYRWLDFWDMGFEEEKEYIRKTLLGIEEVVGEFPSGAYFGRGTPNTAALMPIIWKELGHTMLYTSEVYNDDIPYYIPLPSSPHNPSPSSILAVPYNYDCNDGKFHMSPGFVSSAGTTYEQYLKDTFDCLYREGGKMMTVPLHSRIVGKAGRSEALRRFMEYVKGKEGVWVATRKEIAEHYIKTFPYVEGSRGGVGL